MPFSKVVKNSSYFSRYQTKYRRRREGKTDYYARKRLITQAKNKYGAPKYRLVVRFSRRDITCQIVYSKIEGDVVFAHAHAHELPKYGIKRGLTNWPAAYAVGLLVARRALKKLGLDETYEGVEEADGEFIVTEAVEDGPRPFKVVLDVGLKRTTTGSRVFAALKGASDGGLYIPHSANRYPGWDIESEELDADTLRRYILGGHVAEYMDMLQDDDEERFQKQFAGLIEDGVESDGLEELYLEAHKKIREDPTFTPSDKSKDWKAESLKYKSHKKSLEQRKAGVQERIQQIKAADE
ncbi:60S ribosomal protein L5 [Savitreella phatthalungensis]